ncbi:GHMP family kinase ATP-binding protein [Castellaniella sp. WN]
MNPLLSILTLPADSTVRDAVKCVESGGRKVAFVVDGAGCLTGVVTDGDIRRYLLKEDGMDTSVSRCMNQHFSSVRIDTSREELLKIFDLGYHVIPGVDAQGVLREIYTRELRAIPEVPILARARAPVRMGFCGGGSDLTYFFVDHPAAVLNCTVGLYSHATLMPRKDGEIHIYAEDLVKEEHFDHLQALLDHDTKSLLSSVISVVRPNYGFNLYLRSDFPVGSGLGGSSAATTAVIAAFNELRQDRWNAYEIAELAFQVERLCFGISGGWQDQYASAFGGFNLIEFKNQRNLVHPIRLEEGTRNELEACLLLCDTGVSHDSGRLHDVQRSQMQTASATQSSLLKASVDLCRRMHQHLIRAELNEFGRCLHETWLLKKQFSNEVSNQKFDDIYEAARSAGALGGKLLGAGGGGFFLFYVRPENRNAVIQAVSDLGCSSSHFRFEFNGVTSWRTKA